jgi:DNA-binding NtrC family response regulator
MEKVDPQTDNLIFVVDDDPVITGLVTARLEAAGYRVRSFAYAEECLAVLAEELPDLIILDFYFYKEGEVPMNGMEAYDEITRLAPEIPVIIACCPDGMVHVPGCHSRGPLCRIC